MNNEINFWPWNGFTMLGQFSIYKRLTGLIVESILHVETLDLVFIWWYCKRALAQRKIKKNPEFSEPIYGLMKASSVFSRSSTM